MNFSFRTFKRLFNDFRLLLALGALILLYHFLFKSAAQRTGKRRKETTSAAPFSEQESHLYHGDLAAEFKEKSALPGDTAQSDRVIAAFRHCWAGYTAHAWGYDELLPIKEKGTDWFKMGLTIVDSLDTAFLMGQKDIFKDARDWVVSDLKFNHQSGENNVFEITIRVLGGLLSSYHLSNDTEFLGKAVDLADRLLIAFDTKSHIPLSSVDFKNGRAMEAPWSGASTAEATTLQMEFKYLTYLTKDPKYWNAVQRVMIVLFAQDVADGLVPIYIDPQTGLYSGSEIRLGSRGDSYYEYLAKQYLLVNQTEPAFRTQYRKSMTGVRKHLLGMSHPDELFFVGETDTNRVFVSPKMDHLVCFLPGTLAWHATKGKPVTRKTRALLDPDDLRDLELAEELARSCWEMYAQTATGLAPEIVFWKTIPTGTYDGKPIPQEYYDYHTAPNADPAFTAEYRRIVPENGETDADTRFGARFDHRTLELDFSIHPADGHNLLRPETAESLFILYRITGKKQYREWGWKIFEAFEKYCRVEGGYSSLNDVRKLPPTFRDKMETFFLGETLKYLYLLLTDRDLVPLDRYIFNTEAHPFPVFDFTSTKEDRELLKRLLMV